MAPLIVMRRIERTDRKGNSFFFASVKFEVPIGYPSIDTQGKVGTQSLEEHSGLNV